MLTNGVTHVKGSALERARATPAGSNQALHVGGARRSSGQHWGARVGRQIESVRATPAPASPTAARNAVTAAAGAVATAISSKARLRYASIWHGATRARGLQRQTRPGRSRVHPCLASLTHTILFARRAIRRRAGNTAVSAAHKRRAV